MDYTNITFSGHRDKIVSDNWLMWCWKNYYYHLDNPRWIHGGAYGFDTCVQNFIKKNNITHKIFYPDYKTYSNNPKYAPIARNHEMIDVSHVLITNWDGRERGGTYDTVKYAIEKNIMIVRIPTKNR